MSDRTDRHTALDWAGQIEAERLAHQRGTSWAELDAAIAVTATDGNGTSTAALARAIAIAHWTVNVLP